MPEMIVYDHAWPASFETCPPDDDFGHWLAEAEVKGKTIFHFGTGEHHRLGTVAARLGNHTIGITASRREMDAYEELVIGQPWVAHRYQVLFGDIYLLNPALLPTLDIVTLFHLCEFTDARRMDYGGCSDAELCDRLLRQLRPQGRFVVYPGSMAYNRAQYIIDDLVGVGRIRFEQQYRSLAIYRKQGVMR